MELEINQLISLLGGDDGRAAQIVAWMGTARLFAKLFSSWLQQAAERAIAIVTATDDPYDDKLVARLFTSKPYRIIAFVVDWIISIKLPLRLDNRKTNMPDSAS
jgi:hypothetical protein